MSHITALEEIRLDKKVLEELIKEAVQAFEAKYPGFEIEGIETGHWQMQGDYYN